MKLRWTWFILAALVGIYFLIKQKIAPIANKVAKVNQGLEYWNALKSQVANENKAKRDKLDNWVKSFGK